MAQFVRCETEKCIAYCFYHRIILLLALTFNL